LLIVYILHSHATSANILLSVICSSERISLGYVDYSLKSYTNVHR